MIKKFINYYKPYKLLFFLDLLVAFVAASCDLVYPMMGRELANKIIPNEEFNKIVIFAIILILIYFIKMACAYFMQYWGHVVGVRMQADMRKKLFAHLQKLPCTYFDNTKTGEIMSRIVNDLMDISEFAHHGPEDLFISFVMILGSFFILCSINIYMTIIVFLFVPLVILYTILQKPKLEKAFLKTREETALVNSILQNSISGIRVSKGFVSNKHELKKFDIGNEKFKKSREDAYKVMAKYFSGSGFCIDILDYVVLVVGSIFAYKKIINIGDFIAYLLYIKMFTQPIRRFTSFMEQFQNGMTGFYRYIEMLNVDQEKEVENALDIKNIKGDIEFKNITFSYENKKILDSLNLKVDSGKTLALVGPSGSGKTTLCNLLSRFYDIDSGDILIDKNSIYEMKLDSLRKNIGVVQQDVFLFTGSILENILYGNQEASQKDVIEAAKKANIHDFIISLDNGYDTFIGEKGVKLSGGQKQRISIARVFLKNPAILVLDEATSALDNTTELMIQKSLEEVCKGRTTIIVAHRLSTIKNADEIVVLDSDGIKEKGSHSYLMKKNGLYKNLYDSQFKEKIEFTI